MSAKRGHPRNFPGGDKLLSVNETAALLARSPGTIRNWLTKGYGPRSLDYGGRRLFRESEVKRFLREEWGISA